jgi:hypothetical protein
LLFVPYFILIVFKLFLRVFFLCIMLFFQLFNLIFKIVLFFCSIYCFFLSSNNCIGIFKNRFNFLFISIDKCLVIQRIFFVLWMQMENDLCKLGYLFWHLMMSIFWRNSSLCSIAWHLWNFKIDWSLEIVIFNYFLISKFKTK